jgi:hypothetical protein
VAAFMTSDQASIIAARRRAWNKERKTLMPISYIDVPPGISTPAMKKLVNDIYVALDEACHTLPT